MFLVIIFKKFTLCTLHQNSWLSDKCLNFSSLVALSSLNMASLNLLRWYSLLIFRCIRKLHGSHRADYFDFKLVHWASPVNILFSICMRLNAVVQNIWKRQNFWFFKFFNVGHYKFFFCKIQRTSVIFKTDFTVLRSE